MTKSKPWTHPSVLQYAHGRDPIAAVTSHARGIVAEAIDGGWSGPPFDPFLLADFLNLRLTATGDVRDARTVPLSNGELLIEFNPNRPRGRVRYSVAHEIAHTLFPDCAEKVRNRSFHSDLTGDDWQLETLCNIAAAEFLMPFGSLQSSSLQDVGVDLLMELRATYDVSTEAIFIRAARLSDAPCAVFCASRSPVDGSKLSYRIDYIIGSRGWAHAQSPTSMPSSSIVGECTAIGYTAKGVETWGNSTAALRVECVGIPAYPGSPFPRVVGLLRPNEESHKTGPAIQYIRGNATDPRGTAPRLIVHIVNDKTANWGGNGFARAVAKKWRIAQEQFQTWAEGRDGKLDLGTVHFAEVEDGTIVASIVAQKGYGPSTLPRVRYAALRKGLGEVADYAERVRASVHMPRIGCGQAGGSWEIVSDLILSSLCERGLSTTVYDLPTSEPFQRPAGQRIMRFQSPA